MKRLVTAIVLGIIIGLLCTAVYDGALSPNDNYFAKAAEKSDAWAAELRRQSGAPCYVFSGGSETRMGIDPQVMLQEYGIRAINAGGTAGYGQACNTVLSLRYLQKGDTMLIGLRGTHLPADNGMTDMGLKFCFRLMGMDMFNNSILPLNFRNLSRIARGNAGEWSMYITKLLATPGSMFKYDQGTIHHDSGWCENRLHGPLDYKVLPPGTPLHFHIHDNLSNLLIKAKQECEAKGCTCCVYIFANYCSPSYTPYLALLALKYMDLGLNVVKDESFGCYTDPADFADTAYHLSPGGTLKQSRKLAQKLKNQEFWTREELTAILRYYGYDTHGNCLKRSKTMDELMRF